MKKYKLDALVAGAGHGLVFSDFPVILEIGGFLKMTVPAGYIEAQTDKLPFGIFFGVLKGYEPKLIEQATKVRKLSSI